MPSARTAVVALPLPDPVAAEPTALPNRTATQRSSRVYDWSAIRNELAEPAPPAAKAAEPQEMLFFFAD